MKLRPVNDKIVIKPKDKEEEYKTDSGIILPDIVDQGKLSEGTVLAIGEGMYSTTGDLIPMSVKEGERVLFNSYSSNQEHKLNGETVYIMSQNEILSVIED